jgi:gliding motility-associated protein GldL
MKFSFKAEGIAGYLQSKKGKVTLNYLYGWGASVVIIGALFKIRHLPGADFFLTLGLGTEALIFFVSGFEAPAEETDWSLVYPELAGGEAKAQPATLDSLMREANLEKDVLENLGRNFQALNSNVQKMGELNTAGFSSGEFAEKVNEATQNIGNMSHQAQTVASSFQAMSNMGEQAQVYNDQMATLNQYLISANQAYQNSVRSASDSILDLDQIGQETKAYRAEMRKLIENIGSFNAMYDEEIKQTAFALRSASENVGGVGRLMDSIKLIQEDAERYQSEMSRLNRNIASLNSVYGNMLNAMSNRF